MPTITAGRKTLPRHRKNVALDLIGVGTSWAQGVTSFTLSGSSATGSSITQTIINGAGLARLVLTIADIDGQLTISDGTTSVTLAVHYIAGYPAKRWISGL